MIKKILKRYSIVIIFTAVLLALILFLPDKGRLAADITYENIKEMATILPAIFILLGLLDVWVSRETMIKLMGEGSRFTGIILAFLLGSAAAGPLYAAFPISAILVKKGCKFTNVLIFIGAWSTTKIPMILFEASSLGLKFMLLRFALNIPVILLIAYLTEKFMKSTEIEAIYENMKIM